MSALRFEPVSPAQMRALGRLGKLKDPPVKFIIGFPSIPGESTIVVVPASSKDRRRWDIPKGGKITRSVR